PPSTWGWTGRSSTRWRAGIPPNGAGSRPISRRSLGGAVRRSRCQPTPAPSPERPCLVSEPGTLPERQGGEHERRRRGRAQVAQDPRRAVDARHRVGQRPGPRPPAPKFSRQHRSIDDHVVPPIAISLVTTIRRLPCGAQEGKSWVQPSHPVDAVFLAAGTRVLRTAPAAADGGPYPVGSPSAPKRNGQ